MPSAPCNAAVCHRSSNLHCPLQCDSLLREFHCPLPCNVAVCNRLSTAHYALQ